MMISYELSFSELALVMGDIQTSHVYRQATGVNKAVTSATTLAG
jgi:hypothetical protein